MILSDERIHDLCARYSTPLVEPSDPDMVQPASYDFKLGNRFRVFNNIEIDIVDLGDPATYRDITTVVGIPDDGYMTIHPGEFLLGGTLEKVNMPNDLVGRVEGKSSLGRLGLIVHATAGYIDPGFTGIITLEMMNLLRVPIRLRPGRPICQLSFHRIDGTVLHPYAGRYQGDTEVAASRL